MDKLSLEAHIKAEFVSFSGEVGLYTNDFRANVININANEEFEAARCIKIFVNI